MSDVHELYTDLLALLREMLSRYQQLLTLSQQERQVLTAASLPTLLALTTHKETLVLELSVIEEGRQLVLRKLAEHLGVPVADLSLGRLSTLAPQPFADGFQCCRTDLGALVEAVSQANEQNTLLLSSSLNSVRISLGLLSRLLEPGPTYGSGGAVDTLGTGGKVLQKRV